MVFEYFYEDASIEVKPSELGERCFDEILEQARKIGMGDEE
jgi:hypothetical protein